MTKLIPLDAAIAAITLGRTITQNARALQAIPAVDPTALAELISPDDFHNGIDCRAEVGREGEPCSICASRARNWKAQVQRVTDAIHALTHEVTKP